VRELRTTISPAPKPRRPAETPARPTSRFAVGNARGGASAGAQGHRLQRYDGDHVHGAVRRAPATAELYVPVVLERAPAAFPGVKARPPAQSAGQQAEESPPSTNSPVEPRIWAPRNVPSWHRNPAREAPPIIAGVAGPACRPAAGAGPRTVESPYSHSARTTSVAQAAPRGNDGRSDKTRGEPSGCARSMGPTAGPAPASFAAGQFPPTGPVSTTEKQGEIVRRASADRVGRRGRVGRGSGRHGRESAVM